VKTIYKQTRSDKQTYLSSTTPKDLALATFELNSQCRYKFISLERLQNQVISGLYTDPKADFNKSASLNFSDQSSPAYTSLISVNVAKFAHYFRFLHLACLRSQSEVKIGPQRNIGSNILRTPSTIWLTKDDMTGKQQQQKGIHSCKPC